MFLRSPDLQLFLTAAEAAIRHGMHVPESGAATARRIFTALQTSSAGTRSDRIGETAGLPPS